MKTCTKCFVVQPRATDYIKGVNSPIKFAAVSNDWLSHLNFFERQDIQFETDGCELFTSQESFGAQMDALTREGGIKIVRISNEEAMSGKFEVPCTIHVR